MTCGKHPQMPISGVCSVCGRGVCPNCGIAYMFRLYCAECFERTYHTAAPPPPQWGPPYPYAYQYPYRPPYPEETTELARERHLFLGLAGGILTIAYAFLMFAFMVDLEAEGNNFFLHGIVAAGIYGAMAAFIGYEAFLRGSRAAREQMSLLVLLVLFPAVGLVLAYTAVITIPFLGSIVPIVPFIGYSILLAKMAQSRLSTLGPGTKRTLEAFLYVKVALLIAVMPLHEISLFFWRGPGTMLIFMVVAAVGVFTLGETIWVLRAHSETMQQPQQPQQQQQQQAEPMKAARARARPRAQPRPRQLPLPVPVAMSLVVLFVLLCPLPLSKVNTPAHLRVSQSYGWAGEDLRLTIQVVNEGGRDAEGTIELYLTNETLNIRIASREGMTGFSKWTKDANVDYSLLGFNKTEVGLKIRHREYQVVVVQKGDVKDTSNVRQPTECSGYIPAIILSMAVACYIAPRFMRMRRDGLTKRE